VKHTIYNGFGVECERWHGENRSITTDVAQLSVTDVQRALTIEYLTEAGLFNLESYWEQSVCILKTNRLVRTRMLGGVGGVQHEPAPIPIRVVIPRLRARS
jgi:hypothetical protein